MDAETPTPGAARPKPKGRPDTLTPVRHDAIVAGARLGVRLRDVAFAAGISPRTLRSWLAQGKAATAGKFKKLWDAVCEAGHDRVAALLKIIETASTQLEVRTEKTTTLPDGTTRTEVTVTTDRGRWQAAAWLLERSYPEEFALPILRNWQEVMSDHRAAKRKAKREERKAEQAARYAAYATPKPAAPPADAPAAPTADGTQPLFDEPTEGDAQP